MNHTNKFTNLILYRGNPQNDFCLVDNSDDFCREQLKQLVKIFGRKNLLYELVHRKISTWRPLGEPNEITLFPSVLCMREEHFLNTYAARKAEIDELVDSVRLRVGNPCPFMQQSLAREYWCPETYVAQLNQTPEISGFRRFANKSHICNGTWPNMKILPLTSKLSLEVGTIHFVGIGGIGMSGIAEVLHNLGFTVQGSDLTSNYNTERLAKLGIKIRHGQSAENIEGASVIVISSAVKSDNPEVIAGRESHIPIVRRAEMLAELMRLKIAIAVAGTHGKTTTTTMIATIMEAAKFDPTVINGGIINAFGTNARLGKSEWMVVEADESDGTFNKIPATVAVVTNIEPEHLDFYGNFEKVKDAFRQFVSNIPFYGFAVMCLDHPEVQALIGQIMDRRIISYGLNPQAEIRAENIRLDASGSTYDAIINGDTVISDIHIPMPGNHNILNSLAAIAVAHELKIKDSVIKRAFANFEGVKRRFTKIGEVGGVTIIDDYGHHPTEIMATLQAARSVTKGNVIAVVQPHRFTRLRDLFEQFATCFNDADKVIITNIYTAGEEPIKGITRDALIQNIKSHGHKFVMALDGEAELPQLIKENTKPGDIVICLGAGSITNMAAKLPEQLQKLSGKVA